MIDIDFETRSRVDIRMGPWRYASDKSTSVLVMAYKIGKAKTRLWLPGDPMPDFVKNQLWDLLQVRAHNAMFEKAVWRMIMVKRYGWPDIPDSCWKCSAAKCAALSLPRSLDAACTVMDTEIKKDGEGTRVMMKLSKPRKPTKNNPKIWHEPEDAGADFKVLYSYCKTDVDAEACLDAKLRDLSEKEERVWQLDQKINSWGVCIDQPAAKGAIKIIEEYRESLLPRIAELSGGRFETTDQLLEFKRWLEEKGFPMESLGKDLLDEALKREDLPDDVREMLEIRKSLSKASTKKITAMLGAVCLDGRVKDLLMYHGASTGRWAGKNIQIQNFPRRKVDDLETRMKHLATGNLELVQMLYGDPMDTVSACLRGMIIAAPGNHFYVADYAAIEARGVCWLAGQESSLKLFRENKDIYRKMASSIYSIPIDNVDGGEKDGPQRQLGKQAVLGCGYQMGAPKFQATCQKYQMAVDLPLAERAVATYRDSNDRVVQMWWDQERAAKQAVITKKAVRCGKIVWGVVKGFLYCRLPSGRCLAYPSPKIEMGKTPWGEDREQLSYMQMDEKNRWVRIRSYGGKLVENITQAVCRDVMAEAMLRLDAAGYNVLFTVHDEIVCETPKDFGSLDEFLALLTTVPDWAEGFPIKAEGWNEGRYRK